MVIEISKVLFSERQDVLSSVRASSDVAGVELKKSSEYFSALMAQDVSVAAPSASVTSPVSSLPRPASVVTLEVGEVQPPQPVLLAQMAPVKVKEKMIGDPDGGLLPPNQDADTNLKTSLRPLPGSLSPDSVVPSSGFRALGVGLADDLAQVSVNTSGTFQSVLKELSAAVSDGMQSEGKSKVVPGLLLTAQASLAMTSIVYEIVGRVATRTSQNLDQLVRLQ